MENQVKICQSCKASFTIEPEDFDFYKKMSVPAPTWCPDCRMIRRWTWRNERTLFRRKDAVSGKEIFSNFPPHVDATIYELSYWNSDAWDPMEYGRDYDFSRAFFEQFRDLLYRVPWPSRSVLGLVNSDYCDQSGYLKNCYLCFNGDEGEDCAYCVNFSYLKDCVDLREAGKNELCYDSAILGSSYKTFFSLNSESCRDVWFCKNCTGCNNCFGCVNLKNKSYHIWNKPYSKEDYFKKLQELNLGSYKALNTARGEAREFWKKFPVKFMRSVRVVNVSGEGIWACKNVHDSYSIMDSENMRYCQFAYQKCADCYDYSVWGDSVSEMYECMTCGEQSSRMKFCFDCWPSSKDVEYSMFCRSSSDLFGCVGLKKKRFCIFNKQYSEDEYKKLRGKIVSHMNEMPYKDTRGRTYTYGEFFPPEFSPFAYNEIVANDLFPLSKEEAVAKGYLWHKTETRKYETTMSANDLPDHINDVTDSITKEIIKCVSCSHAYRIVKMEFNFLKRMGLPLPRLCPNCRYGERFKNINPPKFYERACTCAGVQSDDGVYKNAVSHFHGEDHCPNKFKTSYVLERKDIVYCEQCYQAEVA